MSTATNTKAGLRSRPSEALPQALLVLCTVASALLALLVVLAVARGAYLAVQSGASTAPWIELLGTTVRVTAIAMALAVPLAFAGTVAMRELATANQRALLRPWLTLLATMPPVVFAYGALELGRLVGVGPRLAGLTLGLLLAPFLTRLLDTAMRSAPEHLRDAALALGSTRLEAWRQVLLPTAATQVASAIMFTMVRAVGEGVIVALVAHGSGVTLAAAPMNDAMYGRALDAPDAANIGVVGLVLVVGTVVLHRIAARLAGQRS
jgi:ABC-type phosphate transport system permease subunit